MQDTQFQARLGVALLVALLCGQSASMLQAPDEICTLQEAIDAARFGTPAIGCPAIDPADETGAIRLPAGVFDITGLDRELWSDLTIIGSGQDQTFLQAGTFDEQGHLTQRTASSGFNVYPSEAGPTLLRLEHLTVRGATRVNAGGFIDSRSSVDIRDVTFSDNLGYFGGAIAINGGALRLERVTFKNNIGRWHGGAVYIAGKGVIKDSTFIANTAVEGGALAVGGAGTEVTVESSVFRGNSASVTGGAIKNTAQLSLRRVTIDGNSVDTNEGGGILSTANLIVDSSAITSNIKGGGIKATGTTAIRGSVIVGNTATHGAGIFAQGSMEITNTTIAGNVASVSGGGIYFNFGETMRLKNVTVLENIAQQGDGGGIYRGLFTRGVTLSNTIVAFSSAASGAVDCAGEFPDYQQLTSLGHNFIGNNTCLTPTDGDQLGSAAAPLDPKLGPLQNNGGTLSYEPFLDSPVVDTAAAVGDTDASCADFDQHGVPRPQRLGCDIGAVERANRPPVGNAITDIHTNEDAAVAVPLSGTDDDGDALTLLVPTAPLHGSLDIASMPFIYTPHPNFNGTDTFAVQAVDAFGAAAGQTVAVHVAPINDPPSAVDDSASVPADVTSTIDVLANDTTAPDDGELLTVVSVTAPQHGVAVGEGSHIRYTPNLGFSGVDTFSYTVGDGSGEVASGEVVVTVDAPTVVRVEIHETIGVSDAVAITPAVLVGVEETITVSEEPTLTLSAVISIEERIEVTDEPAVTPPLIIEVAETIAVNDAVLIPRQVYAVQTLFAEDKAHKSGSTIQIRLQVLDAAGANISAPSLRVRAIALSSSLASATPTAAGNSNRDGWFRYDEELDGYVFNLKATGLRPGDWTLAIEVGGVLISDFVTLRIR